MEALKEFTGVIRARIDLRKTALFLMEEAPVGERTRDRWNIFTDPAGILHIRAWKDEQDREEEEPGEIATFTPSSWRSMWSSTERLTSTVE